MRPPPGSVGAPKSGRPGFEDLSTRRKAELLIEHHPTYKKRNLRDLGNEIDNGGAKTALAYVGALWDRRHI